MTRISRTFRVSGDCKNGVTKLHVSNITLDFDGKYRQNLRVAGTVREYPPELPALQSYFIALDKKQDKLGNDRKETQSAMIAPKTGLDRCGKPSFDSFGGFSSLTFNLEKRRDFQDRCLAILGTGITYEKHLRLSIHRQFCKWRLTPLFTFDGRPRVHRLKTVRLERAVVFADILAYSFRVRRGIQGAHQNFRSQIRSLADKLEIQCARA